jgi:CheY-like chemotaxis protein
MKEDKPQPDKSTSQYLNDIGNDFNNILTTILNNISLAMLHIDDKTRVQNKLEEIEKASLRARDLIQQLFVLSDLTNQRRGKISDKIKSFHPEPTKEKVGKILLVDDDETILDTIGEFLSTWGYKVTVAKSGELAIQEYKANKYDVIIIDLTMPTGLNGIETLQIIRQVIDPDVKAIISSGYSNDPVTLNYEKYGFKDSLIKPYRIDELVNKINQMLQN